MPTWQEIETRWPASYRFNGRLKVDETHAVWTIRGRHNVALLNNKLEGHELRGWYASRAVQHGWSVAVLEHQIRTSLHTRAGAAPNNLEARLPGEGTDMDKYQELLNDRDELDEVSVELSSHQAQKYAAIITAGRDGHAAYAESTAVGALHLQTLTLEVLQGTAQTSTSNAALWRILEDQLWPAPGPRLTNHPEPGWPRQQQGIHEWELTAKI